MNIDWFTFVAQIVNFLVLVALLRWVLYGRIVRSMKQREDRIAGQLREADQKRAEAEAQAERYEEKTRDLERRREEMLQKARDEAQQERERLRREAREDVEHKRRQWEEAYRRQRRDLLDDLRRQVGRAAVETARRTLAQVADADLEARICETFAERIRQFDDAQRDQIARQMGNGRATVLVRTAFEVPDDRRRRLRDAIRESTGADVDVSFEQAKDLICGLELDIGGYRFGWNVQEFLGDLELEFDEQIEPRR